MRYHRMPAIVCGVRDRCLKLCAVLRRSTTNKKSAKLLAGHLGGQSFFSGTSQPEASACVPHFHKDRAKHLVVWKSKSCLLDGGCFAELAASGNAAKRHFSRTRPDQCLGISKPNASERASERNMFPAVRIM